MNMLYLLWLQFIFTPSTVFCRTTWPMSSSRFTKNRSVGSYSVDTFATSPGAAIGAESVLCCDCEINGLSWAENLLYYDMRSVSCSIWLAGAFFLLACAGCYCKAHVEPFDGSWFNSPCVDSSNTHQTSMKHVLEGQWLSKLYVYLKISKYVSYVLCV